ncbi:MAG: SDR family NAD(P)-dependent oxidoreductase, partial [Pseudomonadota bacterium]
MTQTRTAAITGSTGGIGAAVADILAASGWRLVLINRSAEKAVEQKARLLKAHPVAEISTIEVDLMDVAAIRSAMAQVRMRHPRIDTLYNIAGVLTSERKVTAQGHESHYAVNVLANYLMIEELRPSLSRPSRDEPSMVVTMSSSAIKSPKNLDVDSLSNPTSVGGLLGAYATSKLALTAMGAALAPQLQAENILIRSIDPGPTMTPMIRRGDGMPTLLRWIAPLVFSDAAKQARKIVAAADPGALDGQTGVLVSGGRRKALPRLAEDVAKRDALVDKLVRDAA